MIFCVLLQWWKSDRHKHDSRFNTDWSHAQWRDAQWRDALSGEVLSEEMLSVKRCSQWRDAQWLKPHPALVQVLSSIPRILIQLVTISCNLGPGRSDSSESMYTDMYNTSWYTDIYIIKRESLKKKRQHHGTYLSTQIRNHQDPPVFRFLCIFPPAEDSF